MVEQMEFVDVEGIMSEIRTQIKERGYTKKDLKFADMFRGRMGTPVSVFLAIL